MFFFYFERLCFLACSHSELIPKLWILYKVGRTPWSGDLSIARLLPTQNKTNIITADRHYASGEIWNHNPSVWLGINISGLSLCSLCDHLLTYYSHILVFLIILTVSREKSNECNSIFLLTIIFRIYELSRCFTAVKLPMNDILAMRLHIERWLHLLNYLCMWGHTLIFSV
jgi:hypothetical protein